MTIAAPRSWEPIESPASLRERQDRISVLFVQDDPDVAEMYRMKLHLDGYDVTVINPEEITTRSLAESGAELVFVDIRAPHKERAQVLRKLRVSSGKKRPPVVILSDYNDEELKAAGIIVKSADYLVINVTTPRADRQRTQAWANELAAR